MKERTLWNGKYRDIHFEIQRFDSVFPKETKYSWTHYIYIWDVQLPEALRETLEPKIYYTSFGTRLEVPPDKSIFNEIEFHGGMTYYKKELVTEYGALYKVGCDYQHLWDMGKEYSVEFVQVQAQKTIDSLYDHFPKLKSYDTWYEENVRPNFPGADSEFRTFNWKGEPIDRKD